MIYTALLISFASVGFRTKKNASKIHWMKAERFEVVK